MNAVIDFAGDAFTIPRDKPMGRNFAGHGFLSALSRHASAPRITGLVRDDEAGAKLKAAVQEMRADRQVDYVTARRTWEIGRIGCLYTSGIPTASLLWTRELHGSRAWSLCGLNHTLSSARAMDAVAGLLTAPVQPWDALICTSRASRDVIRRLLERQAEYLSRRLGASRFVLPQLPVIPLGVDCEAQARHAQRRGEARAALGIAEEDVAVLFLGRLSFHSKAHPAPMYLALERVAGELPERRRVVLLECGYFANQEIARAFEEARTRLCPSVRSLVLDGRAADSRADAWAAADIFCSLSDNIQESFGLTPIEAMGAGLPVVVSDWDGYRDTVRDGVDGFAVPTILPPPGTGTAAATRHALGLDTYDAYIGQIAATTAVDVDAAAEALRKLVADPDLRRRMGASAAARAREAFDWAVIVRAYEELWGKLAELRQGAGKGASPDRARTAWPARPDPFELFSTFPTSVLTADHRVFVPAGLSEEEVSARLRLRVSMVDVVPGISLPAVLSLWQTLGVAPVAVRDVLASESPMNRQAAVRALLLLAKAGLVVLAAR